MVLATVRIYPFSYPFSLAIRFQILVLRSFAELRQASQQSRNNHTKTKEKIMFDYPKLNEALSLRLKQLMRQRVRVRIEDSHAPLVVIYLADDVFALQGDEAAQLITEAEILEEAYDLYRCDALLLAAADYIAFYT